MLKRFLERFRKAPEIPESNVIELSKIDKHMNFLLRDSMGYINKNILARIVEINHKKEEITLSLREFHKAQLMNAKIPEREINIMGGNRDNYIKRISHFVTGIDVPKNYLDTYDYCIRFSKELEGLNHDVQKNIFVLQHFFENEIHAINKGLHDLEELIIDIRVLLEKNGVELLKAIQKDIKEFTTNIVKVKDFKRQIDSENQDISVYQEKLDRLNERIKTITTGTDYRALETFKQEKDDVEKDIKRLVQVEGELFSNLDTALKKFYYLNPDKKIIKDYMDDFRTGLAKDHNLEIIGILKGIKDAIDSNQIDLKDKKKDNCLDSINKLTEDYARSLQSSILKLEEQRQHAQAKITHNSASLNLSEQQYWINATEDKIRYHKSNIEKLEKNIDIIKIENEEILGKIKKDIEGLMHKPVDLKDDLTDSLLEPKEEVENISE